MSCKKCGNCCKRYPCSLVPRDLKKIASYLKITTEKLFNTYLCIDYWEGDERQYYLCPDRKSLKFAGKLVSWEWAFDTENPCVFFDEAQKSCKIYKVRPLGARNWTCDEEDKYHDKLWYANKWKEYDLIKEVKE